MKLIDIANRIDKSKQNECEIDVTDFNCEFNYEFDDVDNIDRLKCYWIGNWCCTDSYVGYRMYFFDNEPVAMSIQKGRKCYENINWFNKEYALKVREYLISIMPKPKEKDFNFSIRDINEEVGNSYKINFNSQRLNQNKPTLDGHDIEILEEIPDEENWGIGSLLKIKTFDGEEKIVDIKELDFKFYLL